MSSKSNLHKKITGEDLTVPLLKKKATIDDVVEESEIPDKKMERKATFQFEEDKQDSGARSSTTRWGMVRGTMLK